MLVHMTPKEVQGLQALAMASGGSLTINPQTGLPEAGWLSKLLPTIAGAALNFFVPGLGAAGSAALVGTASAAASGSLKQGLMAGLGAYGGANLMGAANAAGANAINAASNATNAVASPIASTTPAAVTEQAVADAAAKAGSAGAASNVAKLQAIGGQAPAGAVMPEAARAADVARIANNASAAGAAPMTAENLKKGWGIIGKSPDTMKQFLWDEKLNAAAAAAPLFQTDAPGMPQEKGMIRPYTFDRSPLMGTAAGADSEIPFNSTAEQRYFTDNWVAHEPYKASKEPKKEYAAATGGIVALATGGTSATEKENPLANKRSTGTVTSGLNPQYQGVVSRAAKNKYTIPAYSFDPKTGTYTLLARDSDEPFSAPAAAPATPTPATAVQIANMYNSALRRPPTRAELDAAMQANTTTDALRTQLSTGDEYLNNLTKPFAPRIAVDDSGRASVEGAFRPYRSPAEQLGLADFYRQMDAALATQMPQSQAMAYGGMADGGAAEEEYESHLGSYSDGGRLLRGPGDGVSDSIPAMIGKHQPAQLADGEFVVPARIVSELGNGSTEAGARKLYAMMDRVQKARRKSVGKDKVAVDSKSDKYLPA